MLKDAREGKFDVVIVDKIDRFYRHLSGLLSALDQLNSIGVSLASVQDKLDFTTPWGKLILTVLGMLAEIYIDNLRQETKKGHCQRARSGLWNGGIPFGYCNGLCSNCTDANGKGYCPNYGKPNLSDGKRLIAHPIESIAVKLAFEWYATGEESMTSIAKRLSQTKVSLPDGSEALIRQKGLKGYSDHGPFSKDVVRGILRRLAYTGKIPYVGFDDKGKYRSRKPPQEVFDGLQPALVSQELFDQVNSMRKLLGNTPIQPGRDIRCYPLSSILRCGHCGATMRGVSSLGKYFSYDDANKIDALMDCQQKPIKAAKIEDEIAGLLLTIVNRADEQRTMDALDELFAMAERRFQRAQELYLAGEINREYYEGERERYEEQEKNLPEEKLRATIALFKLPQSELPRWDELLPIDKKRLLRLVLEGAWIRGNALVAQLPTIAFLPILGGMGLSICGEGGCPLIRA